jgi:HK97 family phage major capsid protein
MTIAELNAKQAREKLGAKQDELGKVFAEAKGDGGEYDYRKVTHFGPEVKGSVAVAEKIKQLTDEADALAKHAETLEAADQAAAKHAEREKSRGGFRHSDPGRPGNKGQFEAKSLGELITETKAYQGWSKSGGIDLSFPDLWLSDMLAKGASFDTLGSKTLMTTGAGYAPQSLRLPDFVEMATRPIQFLDILPMFQTGSAAMKYMEETTRTHSAAEVLEGGTYAESAFAFTERTSSVVKIGDSIPVTDEQLEDVPMMNGYVNGRLTFGVRQRLDSQAQIGNGTSPNLRGLKNVSGIQTQALGTDPIPDAFYKAMTKIRTIGRAIPTHHVAHPNDWQKVRLLRTADGIYIWGSPAETGPDRLWGLPVVQSDADSAGTGYTGSFQPSWVSLFERKGIDVQVGYVGTQFVEGKRTIRADTRVALVWFRPAAFCSVTGL